MRIKHRWLEIREPILRSDERVWADQTDDGKIYGDDFLHPVIQQFSRLRLQGRKLLLHQLIDLRLPSGCRVRFANVPHMIVSRRHLYIHLRIRIDISSAKPEDRRIVVMRLKNSVENRTKLQRYNLHRDS